MTTSIKHDAKPDKSAVAKVLALDKPNLKGDWSNFFLLLLLYTIQGLPLGLISYAIPVLLQSNKYIKYQDQASFSVVQWPYTLKLLWAPLVDALYVRKIGRRKSWLIPVQFIMGLCFLYLANDIDNLLDQTIKPNMTKLIYVFFFVIIMVATQDIVVDGWALTILKKNNVGYASTCNTLGLAIGSMIGSVSSTLLTSEQFCNNYFRDAPATGGILSLKNLLYTWGIVLMTITILIAIFKTEEDCFSNDDHIKLNIFQNYKLLWKILKLPSVQILTLALLTAKIGFAATDFVSILKLVDAGVSKDEIMVMQSAMFAIKMIIPIVIAKYTSGPNPIGVYLNTTLIRLLWNISFVALIYCTPMLIKNKGVVNIPMYYYAILLFVFSVHEILLYTIFVAILAFFSRISDPHYGGTYMTLLNTLSNCGNSWTSYVALKMVHVLTVEDCSSIFAKNICNNPYLKRICKVDENSCLLWDGYYIEMAVCTVIGVAWFFNFKSILKNLQNKNVTKWWVNNAKHPIITKKEEFTITVT